MKYNIYILAVFIMIFNSCDNSLDVNAEAKDIPIVYGLLNKGDTAQYIKIERVFQAGEKDAFETAKILDSLYYPNATLQLVNVTKGINVNLERVDGAQEGYPRADGIFLKEPNYLYKVNTAALNMSYGDFVKMELSRDENSELVIASTQIVETPLLLSPNAKPDFNGDLSFSSLGKFRVKRDFLEYGKAMDFTIFINIREIDHSGLGSITNKTLEWKILKGYEKQEYRFDGGLFYSFIASNLEVNNKITRTLTSIDLHLSIGGSELSDFNKIGSSNSFSITSSESLPNYTNLSEGYGIFSSISDTIFPGFGITQTTLDTLRDGPLTKAYNFN